MTSIFDGEVGYSPADDHPPLRFEQIPDWTEADRRLIEEVRADEWLSGWEDEIVQFVLHHRYHFPERVETTSALIHGAILDWDL